MLKPTLDYGFKSHGQTWWYDEYDGGAGSSLAMPLDPVRTALTLAPGTGHLFAVGDVLHLPLDMGSARGDEQMLVRAVTRDTLSVQRGYNHTAVVAHSAGTKVMTMPQLAAGLGWLGHPLGAATPMTLTSPNQLTAGGDKTIRTTAPWRLTVTAPAAAVQQGGGADAPTVKVMVSRAAAVPWRNSWRAALIRGTVRLSVGDTYTLSFRARGTATRNIEARIKDIHGADLGANWFTLNATWQWYTLSFVAARSATDARVEFDLGWAPGTVWLDGVQFQQGDPNVWRRDFTHGMVVLNATDASRTVALVGHAAFNWS